MSDNPTIVSPTTKFIRFVSIVILLVVIPYFFICKPVGDDLAFGACYMVFMFLFYIVATFFPKIAIMFNNPTRFKVLWFSLALLVSIFFCILHNDDFKPTPLN